MRTLLVLALGVVAVVSLAACRSDGKLGLPGVSRGFATRVRADPVTVIAAAHDTAIDMNLAIRSLSVTEVSGTLIVESATERTFTIEAQSESEGFATLRLECDNGDKEPELAFFDRIKARLAARASLAQPKTEHAR